MFNIQPFCGLRYNKERIGDLSSVICPPYDTISLKERELYYLRSPYNAVRLEIGSPKAGDRLKSWLSEGILCLEKHPAFYILEECFLHQGIVKHRWGLIARVRLREGSFRLHEVTLEENIHNRLNLLRSLEANTSPILGIIHYEGLLSLLQEIAQGEPELSLTDDYRVTHNLWIVRDEPAIAKISALADKVIYIADGHHRYEAALAYKREKRAFSGEEAFNFIMAALVDAQDPGLVILPIHRLVRLSGDPAWLKGKLSLFFSCEELPPLGLTQGDSLDYWLKEQEKSKAIGAYGLVSKHFCLLKPRGDREDLEANLLHKVILPQILGINRWKEKDSLEYTQDGLGAINQVDSGGYIAFFLNPPTNILSIADKGELMPPKSTYFYPKLPAGLVMNPLWV